MDTITFISEPNAAGFQEISWVNEAGYFFTAATKYANSLRMNMRGIVVTKVKTDFNGKEVKYFNYLKKA